MKSVIELFKKVLFGQTHSSRIRLIRYLLSGSIAFGVDFIVLYILTEKFNIHYLKSSAISFTIGLLITYFFSIIWIFNVRRVDSPWVEFLIFALIGVSGLILNYVFMYVFTNLLGLYFLVSKLLTTVIVFVWNYIAKLLILFTSRSKS